MNKCIFAKSTKPTINVTKQPPSSTTISTTIVNDNKSTYISSVGGMCKLDVINNYFGRSRYNDIDFNRLYIELIEHTVSMGMNIPFDMEYDYITQDQHNIITYILNKSNIPTIYVSIGNMYQFTKERNILNLNKYATESKAVFCFDKNHIWLYKLQTDNKWITMDRGSRHMTNDFDTVFSNTSYGFIFTLTEHQQKEEILFQVNTIISYLHTNNLTLDTLSLIANTVYPTHLLSGIEVNIGIINKLLQLTTSINETNILINNININYGTFIKTFNTDIHNTDEIIPLLQLIIKDVLTINIDQLYQVIHAT
jgi:hypothetical protein